MKTALLVGGAAVGVYFLWRYFQGPHPADTATAAAPSAAASSMTAGGAANTLVGGTTLRPGLLAPLPAAAALTAGARIANNAALAARDGVVAVLQTARADARPEPAPAAHASTGLPILGQSPVLGTLPAYDHGSASKGGLSGYPVLR
jgi:hypothetical protein